MTSCRSGTAPEPSGFFGFVAPWSWQLPLLFTSLVGLAANLAGFVLLLSLAQQEHKPAVDEGSGERPGPEI
jgi:hypothetical protein